MVMVVGTRNVRAAQCFIARSFTLATRMNDMDPPFQMEHRTDSDGAGTAKIGLRRFGQAARWDWRAAVWRLTGNGSPRFSRNVSPS